MQELLSNAFLKEVEARPSGENGQAKVKFNLGGWTVLGREIDSEPSEALTPLSEDPAYPRDLKDPVNLVIFLCSGAGGEGSLVWSFKDADWLGQGIHTSRCWLFSG